MGVGVAIPLPADVVVVVVLEVVFVVVDACVGFDVVVVVVVVGPVSNAASTQYERPDCRFPHEAVMEGFYGRVQSSGWL